MANKSYIHVFGVVGVVVFALVLSLSVGAVFFAGNETALAYEGVNVESIEVPVSLLQYNYNNYVTTVGGSQLQITHSQYVPLDSYYFIYQDDILRALGDSVPVTAQPIYYTVTGTMNKVGTGSIIFSGQISMLTNSNVNSPITGSPFSKSLYGVSVKFFLFSSDESTSSDSSVDITSITMYYYENDYLYDKGYDLGYQDGEDIGYETGFADGEATGLNEGYQEGYSSGYADGKDDGYREGYDEGFDSGVLEGISDGYEQGYQEGVQVSYQNGYDDGYSDGVKTADEIISWSNAIPLSVTSVTPYVDEVDNMHGYSVENATVPNSNVPAIRVSRTAPPMLPACQISLGSTVPAQTIIDFRWEALEPRGLASSGSYINFGALDQYGMYHYLVSSSTDSNNLGFTVSLPVDTQYIVVSTSQSVDYMYLVGVSYRIAGRTAYDIGLNVGYETGYLDGVASIPVDDIKHTAYYEGFDDGVQSANDYTFTSLIGAAIDAPIQAFRGLFGFDVLGTNLANLALSLFTLSIILVVVKFVIKSS